MPTAAWMSDGWKTNWPPAPTLTCSMNEIQFLLCFGGDLNQLTMTWLDEAKVDPDGDGEGAALLEATVAGGA